MFDLSKTEVKSEFSNLVKEKTKFTYNSFKKEFILGKIDLGNRTNVEKHMNILISKGEKIIRENKIARVIPTEFLITERHYTTNKPVYSRIMKIENKNQYLLINEEFYRMFEFFEMYIPYGINFYHKQEKKDVFLLKHNKEFMGIILPVLFYSDQEEERFEDMFTEIKKGTQCKQELK